MRTILGGLIGGVILFVVGFIFWATPLSEIAHKRTGDNESAAVQLALARNLTQAGGTGTYIIPNSGTAQGTVLYGQGPVATVHFNTDGFPVDDMSMILVGFIFALVSGLIMAFGLSAVSDRGFPAMARLVILFSLAVTTWTILAQPVFNHFGWTYWVYSFIAETMALLLAGLAIARWLVPARSAASTRPEKSPDEI